MLKEARHLNLNLNGFYELNGIQNCDYGIMGN